MGNSVNIQRLILLGVIILQPWFYQLVQVNLPILPLSIILALLLTLKNKWSFIVLIILSLGIFAWQLRPGFDKELFVMTPHDVIRINAQRNAFPDSLDQFFVNKPLFFWQKIERNLVYNFDPTILFFAGHPRERLGMKEQAWLSPIFLPFFLLGIYVISQQRARKIFIYGIFVAILTTFIVPSAPQGPLLLFPLSCYLISLGIYQLFFEILGLKIKE